MIGLILMVVKTCGVCGADFDARGTAKMCRRPACRKEHLATRKRKYAREHKGQLATWHRKYNQKRRGEQKAYNRKYVQEHRERLVVLWRKYCVEHKGEKAEYDRKYRREHKDRIKAKARKARRVLAKKKQAATLNAISTLLSKGERDARDYTMVGGRGGGCRPNRQ